jgi:hypothetical protein
MLPLPLIKNYSTPVCWGRFFRVGYGYGRFDELGQIVDVLERFSDLLNDDLDRYLVLGQR